MRTHSEIVERCKQPQSMFGFDLQALVGFLPFEHAQQFLRPEAKADGWKTTPLDRDAVLAEMRDYMAFAWGKVDDHRGISASRSVEKMEAWIWLLGDDDVLNALQAAPYAQYGAPQLKVVCERYDFPIPDDEGIRRMMQGDPCFDGCDNGCGS